MNYVPSMFMIDSTEENGLLLSDSFVVSPFISYQNNDVCNDIIKEKNVGSNNKKRSICDIYDNKKDNDQESKKMRHRDIERQRRQEVSSLFKCLRTLLPFQYIQGRRSTSDHILESVNYIKDLKTKIKELIEKKNQITKEECTSSTTLSSSLTSSLSTSRCTSSSSSSSCVGDKHNIKVMVMPCFVGVEIILSCCVGRNKSCLSSALQILSQDQRLSVVSCISTRIQHRFMHTIVSKVEDEININISEIEDKIMNIMQP
ncbi:unnamed protein product [Cochlearia groenlandica]